MASYERSEEKLSGHATHTEPPQTIEWTIRSSGIYYSVRRHIDMINRASYRCQLGYYYPLHIGEARAIWDVGHYGKSLYLQKSESSNSICVFHYSSVICRLRRASNIYILAGHPLRGWQHSQYDSRLGFSFRVLVRVRVRVRLGLGLGLGLELVLGLGLGFGLGFWVRVRVRVWVRVRVRVDFRIRVGVGVRIRVNLTLP